MNLFLNKESNPMEILFVLISKISKYKSKYLLNCLIGISNVLKVKFGVSKVSYWNTYFVIKVEYFSSFSSALSGRPATRSTT